MTMAYLSESIENIQNFLQDLRPDHSGFVIHDQSAALNQMRHTYNEMALLSQWLLKSEEEDLSEAKEEVLGEILGSFSQIRSCTQSVCKRLCDLYQSQPPESKEDVLLFCFALKSFTLAVSKDTEIPDFKIDGCIETLESTANALSLCISDDSPFILTASFNNNKHTITSFVDSAIREARLVSSELRAHNTLLCLVGSHSPL